MADGTEANMERRGRGTAGTQAGHRSPECEGLQGRKLVIDLQNVTVISREGENGIYELMQEGARFSCAGVLTRHLLKRLAHRCQARFRNVNRMCSSD